MFSELIEKSIFLYIEVIFSHPPIVFFETSWASSLIALIMILHVSNWISIWCSISLVCSELGWVYGDGCVWRCWDWVIFVSNVLIRLFLSSMGMVLRLEPSIISFSSIYLASPYSGNTFSQYMIWAPKDDSRAIAFFFVFSLFHPSLSV